MSTTRALAGHAGPARLLPRLVLRGRLPDLLAEYDELAPTAASVTAQRAWTRPPGHHLIEASTQLVPTGVDEARAAVLGLAVHRRAGLLTAMPHEVVRPNDTVVIGVPVGPLALVVPCRIAWVSDEGFGYLTLPGHPENGEEAFTVADDGAFRVFGYSRPAGVNRLAAPIARAAASHTVTRYLRAAEAIAATV